MNSKIMSLKQCMIYRNISRKINESLFYANLPIGSMSMRVLILKKTSDYSYTNIDSA